MRKNLTRKLRNSILSVMLIVAMAFTVTGCSKNDPVVDGSASVSTENSQATENLQTPDNQQTAEEPQASDDSQASDNKGSSGEVTSPENDPANTDNGSADNNASGTDASAENTGDDANVLGEGGTAFTFTVVDGDGNETGYTINTDKEMVGEALLENGLIAGEESQYGLYVKEVTGITADYDVDQTYWAFYINGEYAMTGVDTTPVKPGETYTFKVEK